MVQLTKRRPWMRSRQWWRRCRSNNPGGRRSPAPRTSWRSWTKSGRKSFNVFFMAATSLTTTVELIREGNESLLRDLIRPEQLFRSFVDRRNRRMLDLSNGFFEDFRTDERTPGSPEPFLHLSSLPAFLQLVFQPLMSVQTGFSIGAWQPSVLNHWSLIRLLPIQHTKDLNAMSEPSISYTRTILQFLKIVESKLRLK